MKKLLFIFTLFFSVIFAVCCSKPEIKLVGEDSVELGCSIVLTTNYEGDEEIVWESSHPNTASVVDGVVTGNEIGDAIITVKIGGVSKSKVITVTSPVIQITIEGETSIIIGKSSKFNATLSKETNEPVEWKSSDTSIATVDSDGKVTGISEGQVIISASVYENKSEFTVFITKKNPYAISLRGKNVLARGEEMQLEYTVYPSDASNELIFVSENEDILTVNASGVVKAVSEGKGVIKAYSKFNESIASTIEIEVKKPAPDEIRISGETEIMQGGFSTLNIDVIGNDVTKEVVWESENPKVAVCYNGIVLGVNKGKTNIRAKSVIDNSVFGSIEISVKAYENKGHTQAEIDKVNEIISKMTLSQKVGQMFVIGFNGTEMNKTLEDVIEEYNFGNVIYMGYNVSRPQTLSKLSNDIQEKMIKENGVPAFITIDQEGGRVARLIDGGTHFISEMAMGATGDYNNTYLEGVAMGKELRNYGINVDFAPVLDVNNNPNNPVIGIRSYSDNPILVSLYGNNMIAGLMESDVMACSKHFPGHGNTSVDSHYGLPTITTPIEELYQTELAPFISSICNGIDSIMTTHIIFTAIDSEYPATLSKKVLTDLLREEIGYDGLIITDGMEMGAVTNSFGDYDKTAVLAVKAGVDILTYTTSTNPQKAHKAIVNAVNNGEISVERINDSVRRILLKKLKYNILDGYLAENKDLTSLLKEHDELNNKFAIESLTLIKGEFNGLDKNKSTLIISPETTYDLGAGLKDNSFANYAANYLKNNGHSKVDYYTVSNNITNGESTELLAMIKDYDQIVIAMSNVKTSNYGNSKNFVNNVSSMTNNLLVIALDAPYDLLSYSKTVENYVCVYGYQKATVVALSKYLNSEFEAKGISSIDKAIFN